MEREVFCLCGVSFWFSFFLLVEEGLRVCDCFFCIFFLGECSRSLRFLVGWLLWVFNACCWMLLVSYERRYLFWFVAVGIHVDVKKMWVLEDTKP